MCDKSVSLILNTDEILQPGAVEGLGANLFCLLISKQKDLSFSGDVITRYLIKKKKLKLKSRSRMFVLKCWIFSSTIV